MATIDKNLIQVSLEEVQDQLIDMLNRYNFPSFGSMSKRDIDISYPIERTLENYKKKNRAKL